LKIIGVDLTLTPTRRTFGSAATSCRGGLEQPAINKKVQPATTGPSQARMPFSACHTLFSDGIGVLEAELKTFFISVYPWLKLTATAF
jgi:hypothetical protein